jgi:hypothetical protein
MNGWQPWTMETVPRRARSDVPYLWLYTTVLRLGIATAALLRHPCPFVFIRG